MTTTIRWLPGLAVALVLTPAAALAQRPVNEHSVTPGANVQDKGKVSTLNFDFQTPPHLIEAVYKAMRDGKNGYAPSPGIPEALEAIRGEAARKEISTVQDVFVTSGASEAVDICLPTDRHAPVALAALA